MNEDIPLRKKDPPRTHEEKPNGSKGRDMISLWWPRDDKEVWKAFVKQMKIDGSSASAQIRDWVRIWWKAHDPGNPQTPLERFQKKGFSRKLERGRHVWHTFGPQGELVKTEVEDIL